MTADDASEHRPFLVTVAIEGVAPTRYIRRAFLTQGEARTFIRRVFETGVTQPSDDAKRTRYYPRHRILHADVESVEDMSRDIRTTQEQHTP